MTEFRALSWGQLYVQNDMQTMTTGNSSHYLDFQVNSLAHVLSSESLCSGAPFRTGSRAEEEITSSQLQVGLPPKRFLHFSLVLATMNHTCFQKTKSLTIIEDLAQLNTPVLLLGGDETVGTNCFARGQPSVTFHFHYTRRYGSFSSRFSLKVLLEKES